jgi:hypothetical protein
MKLYSFENGNINYNTEVESGGDSYSKDHCTKK